MEESESEVNIGIEKHQVKKTMILALLASFSLFACSDRIFGSRLSLGSEIRGLVEGSVRQSVMRGIL